MTDGFEWKRFDCIFITSDLSVSLLGFQSMILGPRGKWYAWEERLICAWLYRTDTGKDKSH